MTPFRCGCVLPDIVAEIVSKNSAADNPVRITSPVTMEELNFMIETGIDPSLAHVRCA